MAHKPDQASGEKIILLDLKGLNCPEPLMLTHQALRKLKEAQVLKVQTDDPTAPRDIRALCRHLGYYLLASKYDPEETSTHSWISKAPISPLSLSLIQEVS